VEQEGYNGEEGEPCSVEDLAFMLMANPEEPIVVLNGRCEVGPRALGNRSIISSAILRRNKDMINHIKGREDFRPVAPICLESFAPRAFDPGTPDPYMLFEHRLRFGWDDVVPAAVHLDGTARLQTVNEEQNPVMAKLLTEYGRLSGIPILCNTSANFNGAGFFPDIASALRWRGVKKVWSEGRLYRRG
jgi:carbamoyltransferase